MSYTISNLMTDILPRVASSSGETKATGISIFQAASSIQSLIAHNLIDRHSDLLATADLSVSIPALGYQGTLPTGFLSVAERPKVEELYTDWMAGTVTSYNNLTGALVVNVTNASGTDSLSSWQIATAALPGSPSSDVGSSTTTLVCGTGTKSLTTQAGLSGSLIVGSFILVYTDDLSSIADPIQSSMDPEYLLTENEDTSYDTSYYDFPRYYKIVGDTIFISPTPTSGVLITGRYFALPASFTAMADIIPWNGKFDEIFREGSVLILSSGVAVPEANPMFMALFNREFNSLINARAKILPKYGRMNHSNWL
jgi:hypothetical protein